VLLSLDARGAEYDDTVDIYVYTHRRHEEHTAIHNHTLYKYD
jgi:hypothetical protein